MNQFDKARAYALKAHGDQKYGFLPYSYHLEHVVELIPQNARCQDDFDYRWERMRVAAWLHDVVEDTNISIDDIRELFGGNVARIVDFCTDQPGANRKERKAKTYERLQKAPYEAKTVKLADRIANMRASIENPCRALMYRKEFPVFIRACEGADQGLMLIAYKLYMDSVEAELQI